MPCLCAATVQISALRVWTLLLSTLPKKFLHPSFVESSLAMLGKLLHDSDVAVRSCAGEALALLFDLSGLANLEDDTAHDHPSPSRTVPNPSSRPPRPSTMSQARPTDAESSDESPTDLERAYRGSDSEAGQFFWRSTLEQLGSPLHQACNTLLFDPAVNVAHVQFMWNRFCRE